MRYCIIILWWFAFSPIGGYRTTSKLAEGRGREEGNDFELGWVDLEPGLSSPRFPETQRPYRLFGGVFFLLHVIGGTLSILWYDLWRGGPTAWLAQKVKIRSDGSGSLLGMCGSLWSSCLIVLKLWTFPFSFLSFPKSDCLTHC